MQVKSITGLKWNDFHFTTVVSLQWVVDNMVSGLVLESAERDLEEGLAVDPRAAVLAPMRKKMQRPFQDVVVEKRSVRGEAVEVKVLRPTAKYRNTKGGLRKYLLEQFAVTPEEAFGVLPGFVAIWPEQMEVQPLDVVVPGVASHWEMYHYAHLGRGALADGECRHLAALDIAADPTVDAALKDKLLNQLVTVEVFHGIDAEKGASMFIDLNFEGTAVAGITKANLDPRNKWINATRRIFEELDIELATTGRQITSSHKAMKQYLLLTHAEQMVKSIPLGSYKALSSAKASWDVVDFDKLHRAAVEWFGEIFDFFGGPEVLVDQSRVIRTVPVRVALASLGEAHYKGDDAGRANATATLRDIDWLVSPNWNGVGGKVTVTEDGVAKMSAGSGKENITRAVQAVTKRDTKAGQAVRTKWRPNRKA